MGQLTIFIGFLTKKESFGKICNSLTAGEGCVLLTRYIDHISLRSDVLDKVLF